MLSARRYNILADRILHASLRSYDPRTTVARIALFRACRPFANVRTLRARAGASAFERADMARLRRDVLAVADRILARAGQCSRLHGEVFRASDALYGEGSGALIAGVGRDHYPELVKARMRRLARAASASGFAYDLIRACGRGSAYYAKARARAGAFGYYG